MLSLRSLNTLEQAAFAEALEGVFERSPWVAAGTWHRRPFASVEALHEAMVAVVEEAGRVRQVDLIRAHPDLAGKAAVAGELTRASEAEQSGAGLDRLTRGEYGRFRKLNAAYRERFGFPFILAVKGHTKESVLADFEVRLENDLEAERRRALREVYKIAGFRLEGLIGEM